MESKQIFSWVLRAVAIIICVGAVLLCVVSALLSILKLVQTYNTPASRYVQKTLTGYHIAPGIVFAGKDLSLHKCEKFNFTSLDIDALGKVSMCNPIQFTIHSTSAPGDQALMANMPAMLQELDGDLTFLLLKGPKDWSNKETMSFHLSIPTSISGVWAVIHPDYEEIKDRFTVASNSASSVEQRWEVARDLLSEFSANFVTPNYQAFYLMSKRIFKKFGVVEAVRVDMEIAILDQNETALDLGLPDGREGDQYEHLELYYQWKDGNYMEGDKFVAANIWTIVTILISSMLMFERAYNTLMKAWGMSKPAKKAEDKNKDKEKEEDKEGNDEEFGAPPDRARSDSSLDSKEGSRKGILSSSASSAHSGRGREHSVVFKDDEEVGGTDNFAYDDVELA